VAQWQQQVLDSRWLGSVSARRFVGSGTIITDDRPFTEYDMLRLLFNPEPSAIQKEDLLKLAPVSLE
jgi:hypothetical protein